MEGGKKALLKVLLLVCEVRVSFCCLEVAQWGESPVLRLLKVCLAAAFKDFGTSALPAGELGLVLSGTH